jgi:hypothetical protein
MDAPSWGFDGPEDGREMIKAANVKAGDRLDLEGDKFADPNGDGIGESGHFYGFEFELAEVESVVRETPGCILIHTSLGSFGFPPDHLIKQEGDS